MPRWLVAPIETVRLWVIMARTPGIDTYEKALTDYRSRVMAVVVMRETWASLANQGTTPAARPAPTRQLTTADVKAVNPPPSPRNRLQRPGPNHQHTRHNNAGEAVPPSHQDRHQRRRRSHSDRTLPTDDGGHIAVKAAARAAGIGFDRARRLLDTAGLLAPRSTDS